MSVKFIIGGGMDSQSSTNSGLMPCRLPLTSIIEFSPRDVNLNVARPAVPVASTVFHTICPTTCLKQSSCPFATIGSATSRDPWNGMLELTRFHGHFILWKEGVQ
jgi:hypothetical protein